MIARTWRGATDASQARNYVDYLRATGFAAFAATPGNRGAIGLRRVRDGKAEFLLVSLWESPQAVARFAGSRPDRAVFYPEDGAFLLERDDHVDHFDVVYADVRPPSVPRRLGRWWLEQWKAVARDVPRGGWQLAAFR